MHIMHQWRLSWYQQEAKVDRLFSRYIVDRQHTKENSNILSYPGFPQTSDEDIAEAFSDECSRNFFNIIK